jgi:hypothetical protein
VCIGAGVKLLQVSAVILWQLRKDGGEGGIGADRNPTSTPILMA